MFNNRFNSSKNDPLVEAVKQAQAEGDLRRQAIAFVNEQFGVFSRNAVVREDLAAYDAAIEEAVKCMKEGKPVDQDKDGDNDFADVMIARMKKGGKSHPEAVSATKNKSYNMKEGSSVSGEDPGMEVAKKAGAAQQSQTPSSTPAPTKSKDLSSTFSSARGAAGMNEAQLDELTGKGRLPALKSAYRDIKKTHSNEADWHAARADRAERRGESKKAEHHMDAGYGHEHKAERAGSKLKRADALQTRAKAAADIKASKAASKSARAEYKEEVMKESIIAKLFAKHMKEQVSIAPGAAPLPPRRPANLGAAPLPPRRPANLGKTPISSSKPGVVSKSDLSNFQKSNPGATLGQYMNAVQGKTAVKGGANDPTSSNFKADKSQGGQKFYGDSRQYARSPEGKVTSPVAPDPGKTFKPDTSAIPSKPAEPAPTSSSRPQVNTTPSGGTGASGGNPTPSGGSDAMKPGFGRMSDQLDKTNSPVVGSQHQGGAGLDAPKSAPSDQEAKIKSKSSSMVAESVMVGSNKYRIV